MDTIIGESDTSLLVLKTTETSQELHLVEVTGLQGSSDLILKSPSTKPIKQASVQQLVKDSVSSQSLLSLVQAQTTAEECFEGTVFLLENLSQFSRSPGQDLEKSASIVILDEILLVKQQSSRLHLHVLPACIKERDLTIPLTVDTPLPTPLGGGTDVVVLTTRVVALSLEECITIYDLEITLSSVAEAKIEIVSSSFIPKPFWWAEWVPTGNFLAFAHLRTKLTSSMDDDHDQPVTQQAILTVFQFRGNSPQETVLNLPLNSDGFTYSATRTTGAVSLAPNPNVLSNPCNDTCRILAHCSGHVSILQVTTSRSKVAYRVNSLHHNQTIEIKTNLPISTDLVLDACLFYNGQFVAVCCYPHFLHLLDIGVEHEPSHHLILDWLSTTLPRFTGGNGDDVKNVRIFAKTLANTQIPATRTGNTQLTLMTSRLIKTEVEINSSLLIPLILSAKPKIKFNLAVIHYLVVHLGDVNAVKKIIYELGRSLKSPYLTEVLQEFLIANAYLVTGKNLTQNMKIFLHFLPYTSLVAGTENMDETETYSMEMVKNTAKVPTIVLSPRQRILTQSESDLWTKLWEVNDLLTKSSRFCHRTVAQKLIFTFQCYQPEALSRATTPMSPSSPMICNSLGDIAALFGRRTSDLQLPFAEHESCTANKQEYVYSVNLRELSTHLLKERRDWPLHCQTVAGKYMNGVVESGRLVCHVTCLCLHIQPNRKTKGFKLIDFLPWNVRLKLFMLFEHISIALGTLACPLPQGFTPFFAYLGYSVLKFDQFLWHVRSGTFDLQIDLVKAIMADMSDSDEANVAKKLHLISLLPKSRGIRVLNSWSHQTAICIRAKQHASDLLTGVTSLTRKSSGGQGSSRIKFKGNAKESAEVSPLDTFLTLLTAKAKAADIDLGLLAEATMLSMQVND